MVDPQTALPEIDRLLAEPGLTEIAARTMANLGLR